MERLRERDFRALLEFLRGLYAPQNLDGFVSNILSALPRAIPSELTSYNEMIPEKRASANWTNPADYCTPAVNERWKQVMHEQPVLAHNQKTHDRRALRVSDFLSRRQLHSMAIYREHYRPMGAEDNLNAVLDDIGPAIVGIALHRGSPDFSDREKLLLELLRPHLTQAWRNAKAVTRMQQELGLVRGIVEALDEGVVVLTHDGSVLSVNARARRWLEDYFGRRSALANRLPEILERWVRHEENLLESKDSVPPSRKPLVLGRTGRRLVVRHLCQQAQCLLLFQERQTTPQPAALQLLGISQRETEVLQWVAYGKTNIEIGTILGLSPRTVQKHLEHIYQKLGVETRTAAAAKAHEVLSGRPL